MYNSISKSRSVRDQTRKEYYQLTHRITNLESQYEKLQGALNTTILKGQQIQEIKNLNLQRRAQRLEHSFMTSSLLSARKVSVAKTQQDQKENIRKSLEAQQRQKLIGSNSIRMDSRINHQQIAQEKYQNLDYSRKIKKMVQQQEEQSRNNLHNWMMDRMKQYDENIEQQKQIYKWQQDKMISQMNQMERYEALLINKLQETQKVQNEVADRLQMLYTSYLEQHQNKLQLQHLPAINEGQSFQKSFNVSSQSKLSMYTQSPRLYDPSTKKLFTISPRSKKNINKSLNLNQLMTMESSKLSSKLSSIPPNNLIDKNQFKTTPDNHEFQLNDNEYQQITKERTETSKHASVKPDIDDQQ